MFVPDRLENSEQEREQSDQSDKDMKMELEGKVDALQKQLTDLDTLRSTGKINRSDIKMPVNVKCCLALTGKYIVTVYGVAASVLRLGLENNLRVEREQRQSLQKALQREQDNSVELRTQLQQLQGLHEVSQEVCMRHGNVPNANPLFDIFTVIW